LALCSVSVLAGDGLQDEAVQRQIRCFGASSDVDGGGSAVGFGGAATKLAFLHGGPGEVVAGVRPARSASPSSSAVTVPASARAPTVGTSSVVPLPMRKRCASFPPSAVGVEAYLLPWLGFCFLGVTGVLWFTCGFGGSSGSSASSTMPLLLGQIPGVDYRCTTRFMSCGSKKLEVAPMGLVMELESRLRRSFIGSSSSKGGVRWDRRRRRRRASVQFCCSLGSFLQICLPGDCVVWGSL